VAARGESHPAYDADEKAQYAKLVAFSRHRREVLGHTRPPEDPTKRRTRQSAPRAFGTNDHGRGLACDEDLPGAVEKVDTAEGMVYAMGDGSTVYFCDRFRRYRFYAGGQGLSLLRGLVVANRRLLAENATKFAIDPSEAARQRAEGYALYEEKPNLRRRGAGSEIGTWSDREYGLPGFQWMYLRLKSYQRFTETWAALERCAHAGLFDAGGCLGDARRVVSLGGGPGYELFAFDAFRRYWNAADRAAWSFDAALAEAPPEQRRAYASLDLQPSWEAYVSLLGYGFHRWDVHRSGAEAVAGGYEDGVVAMLSNIMCYCTDDATADLFLGLLEGPVSAIVANERGAEQGIVALMERRGAVVVRLLDQTAAGKDHRQFIILPPGAPTTLPNIPLPPDAAKVFPNVPYEEKKGVKRT